MNNEASHPEILNDLGEWAQRAIAHIEEWVGARATGADNSILRRSRFSVLYGDAANVTAIEWEKRLSAAVARVIDLPGRRIASLEESVRRLVNFCEQAAAAQAAVVEQQREMVAQSREQLRVVLEQCRSGPGGISRLLGVGQQRNARSFLEQLRVFCYARLAEDSLDAGTQFFKKLRGRLEDRLNDLSFCRQRLRHLQHEMAEPADPAHVQSRKQPGVNGSVTDSYSGVFSGSSTVRIVLPEGAATLEQAAQHFVRHLTPELMAKLDEAIQVLVLSPVGGLKQVCQKTGDLSHILAGPMVDQAAAFLGDHLPAADVIQTEISRAEYRGQSIGHHIQKFYRHAAPLVAARQGLRQTTYLLHPATPSGRQFLPEAQKAIPDLQLVPGCSPTDLSLCREQAFLTLSDLEPLLTLCKHAYHEIERGPSGSPHARFDIQEWLPLEG